MVPETDITTKAFFLGTRRYRADSYKEYRARGCFASPLSSKAEVFGKALRELSAEDEEIPLPDEQGPIVFKDGIFQIDVSDSQKPAQIDPALKGLIDSILGS